MPITLLTLHVTTRSGVFTPSQWDTNTHACAGFSRLFPLKLQHLLRSLAVPSVWRGGVSLCQICYFLLIRDWQLGWFEGLIRMLGWWWCSGGLGNVALLKKYATGVGLRELEDWSPSQLHFCLLLEAQDVSSGLVVLGTEHAFHARRCSL